MKTKVLVVITLAFCALYLFCEEASANRQNPGSCLLFPYYDSGGSGLTIITISNVSKDPVDVRLVYIDDTECSPGDTWIELTGYDTFSFTSDAFTPYKSSGFIYAYAVDELHSKKEIDADVLIGQEVVLSMWAGSAVHFSLNAETFQCLKVQEQDGMLHLDGKEYSAAPRTVYFPRFFGQTDAIESRIILINLTGGQHFNAKLDWRVYNDNEVVFSFSDMIDCHDVKDLVDVSPVFKNSFLLSTQHDPSEPVGLGSTDETGFFEITGSRAWNDNHSVEIDHPSVYAVLIESFGDYGFGTADLPMQFEDPENYNKGMLWSTSTDGK